MFGNHTPWLHCSRGFFGERSYLSCPSSELLLMLQLNFTANVTYVEVATNNDGDDFLAVTAVAENARKEKLTITFNNGNGMLKAYNAGDELVGVRIAGYGTIDPNKVANAYIKEDDLHLYKQPRMHLQYVYVERMQKTPVAA